MLTDLEITGLGVIDRTALRLGPGLNVLTGETGAGKTMVVTALEWLLGGRADKDRVRVGATQAVINARLEGVAALAEDWIDPDESALFLTREVGGRGDDGTAAGRSRVRINGQLSPVATLAEVMAPIVEIHSQHESIRMADPAMQRGLLDRFGGEAVAVARADYDRAYAAWTAATRQLEVHRTSSIELAREADRLRAEVAEISEVDPSAGEDDELDAAIGRLQHASDLRDAATTVADSLTDDGGARDALGTAVAALRGVTDHDVEHLQPLLERLESAMAEIQDLSFEASAYADGIDADPRALDDALGRRAAIGRLLRKYGPGSADVVAYLSDAEERLAIVDGGEERLDALEAAAAAARADLDAVASTLNSARTSAAKSLSVSIDTHLADLAMKDARTTIEVTPTTPAAHGADDIRFLLAANRGQPALPLGRAASGGERSRVALAVKVALADADDTPVMVFDEVDAGIGGETALAVGRKLASLAVGRQVICVTHLAQLAAFADAHFVVDKASTSRTTRTTVRVVEDSDRVSELSRMLSGVSESDAALDHARELLESVRR